MPEGKGEVGERLDIHLSLSLSLSFFKLYLPYLTYALGKRSGPFDRSGRSVGRFGRAVHNAGSEYRYGAERYVAGSYLPTYLCKCKLLDFV